MNAEIGIETANPDQMEKILAPSLESRGKVDLDTETNEKEFRVKIDTEGLGQLRGTTDNVFRLAGLSKKITED